jgi:hypothetical protein
VGPFWEALQIRAADSYACHCMAKPPLPRFGSCRLGYQDVASKSPLDLQPREYLVNCVVMCSVGRAGARRSGVGI